MVSLVIRVTSNSPCFWMFHNTTACTEGTYGPDCSSSCACVGTNTASCDNVNGTCYCKAGWEGSTCSVDKDECQLGQCQGQNENCTNVAGSYSCFCNNGFQYDSSRNCVGEALGFIVPPPPRHKKKQNKMIEAHT